MGRHSGSFSKSCGRNVGNFAGERAEDRAVVRRRRDEGSAGECWWWVLRFVGLGVQ